MGGCGCWGTLFGYLVCGRGLKMVSNTKKITGKASFVFKKVWEFMKTAGGVILEGH